MNKQIAVYVTAALLSIPVFADASSLDISPQLLSSSAPTPVTAPTDAHVGSTYAPLNVNGYAQWKQPLKTLQYEGYGVAKTASSFGSDVPFKNALQLILPNDEWKIYVKTGISGSVPVTWKSKDQPWTVPLRLVLRQSGLMATINWTHKAILIRPKPTEPVKPMDTHGYHSWGTPNHDLPSNFHEGPAEAIAPSLAGASPVFILNHGDLILNDLKKWAKSSGWQIVWDVPEDWEVPNTTTFSGDFKTAVTQVIQALSSNGANIRAVFHMENNTVVITGEGGSGDKN